MAVIIIGIVRSIERIETVSAIASVHPHVRREIFVRVAHSRIQYRHYNVTRGGQHVPAFRCVDVRVRSTAVLPGVVQSPKSSVQIFRIIRRQCCVHLIVWLGEFDQSTLLVFRNEDSHRFSRGHA